jgi:dCMP deaminase
MTNWDRRFMDLAVHIAGWSKDRSRQVGCVFVGEHREVLTTGYNGFPRGIDDGVETRHERPAKYSWTEHAERNAIYNAARIGAKLMGSTVYVPWFPCINCARALIQVGVKRLVCYRPDMKDPTFGEEFQLGTSMLDETHVKITYIAGESPKQK